MAAQHDLLKARRESAALLNLGDVERLSPADALRCDLISTLRLAIDGEQATVLDGGSADLAKLITATENLIRLLPGRALPEPEQDHTDPRQVLWEIYKTMRERGEINLKPEAGLHLRIAELEGEIAALKGGAPPALPECRYGVPDALAGHSTGHAGSAAINPSEADITPPSEIGRAIVGKVAGPDDPRPGPVIDGKAVPPAPAAPASRPPDWDSTPGGVAWNEWRNAGGYGVDRWRNGNIP
jgi:hypothetical protein